MPSQNQIVQLAYQVCPIILTGGIASQILGGILPLLSITNAGGGIDLAGTILPFSLSDLDNAFGTFTVLSNGLLVSQTVAKYPFANQSVAANATIREPLVLSVVMDAPMRGPNAWAIKQMVMTALKGTLDAHNNAGGLYTVMTPAFMYDNMILTSLVDTPRSTGNNPIPQNAWTFNFEKPLVTLADAAAAQNLLTSKLTNGLPTDGQQSGPQIATPGASVATAKDPASLTTTYPITPVQSQPLAPLPGDPGTGFSAAPLSSQVFNDAPAASPQYSEGFSPYGGVAA